jgi:hypothetical protein
MSKILVDTIDTRSGTTNLTIGSTNSSTVTFENGAVTGHMYPAFEVAITSAQTISDDTHTKVQFNSVTFDTNSGWDSSNYRWTPAIAGKYVIYGDITCDSDSNSNLDDAQINPRRSNNDLRGPEFIFKSNPIRYAPLQSFQIVNNVTTSDYFEIFTRINATDSTGGRVIGGIFGGYRIGS